MNEMNLPKNVFTIKIKHKLHECLRYMLLKICLLFFLVTDPNRPGREILRKIVPPSSNELDKLRWNEKVAEPLPPQMRDGKIHYLHPLSIII